MPIRAKKLEWKPYTHPKTTQAVMPHTYTYIVQQIEPTAPWWAVADYGEYYYDLGKHDTLEAAKAVCQIHADSVAREIAEECD